MPRLLQIADPCAEPWAEMIGSTARRRCDRCEKHVHALAELTPAEVERLLASAPPGGLCVRVEHDEAGRVRLREEEPAGAPGRGAARIRLVVGASLLAAACGSNEPAPLPDPAALQPEPALHAQEPPRTEPGAAPPAPTQAPAASSEPAVQAAAAAPQPGPTPAAKSPAPWTIGPGGKHVQQGSGHTAAGDSRVTMGCLCAPQDSLCDCM